MGPNFNQGWITPQQPQRQDSLSDQLKDVIQLATRAGCYDAADWIRLVSESSSDESSKSEKLEEAARKVVEAWERFNDPNIRVGPVFPTMRELKKVLDD